VSSRGKAWPWGTGLVALYVSALVLSAGIAIVLRAFIADAQEERTKWAGTGADSSNYPLDTVDRLFVMLPVGLSLALLSVVFALGALLWSRLTRRPGFWIGASALGAVGSLIVGTVVSLLV
jgi:hypothetical protein